MKECSDTDYPCNHGILYMDKYDIYSEGTKEEDNIIYLIPKINGIDVIRIWWDYVEGNKQPLLDAIKEFKKKYNL